MIIAEGRVPSAYSVAIFLRASDAESVKAVQSASLALGLIEMGLLTEDQLWGVSLGNLGRIVDDTIQSLMQLRRDR